MSPSAALTADRFRCEQPNVNFVAAAEKVEPMVIVTGENSTEVQTKASREDSEMVSTDVHRSMSDADMLKRHRDGVEHMMENAAGLRWR
eukprot:2747072-Rhodomonas_salina.3